MMAALDKQIEEARKEQPTRIEFPPMRVDLGMCLTNTFARDEIARTIRAIYDETHGHAYDLIASVIDDAGALNIRYGEVSFDEYESRFSDAFEMMNDFYHTHKVIAGTPRERTGIASTHGIINPLSEFNERASGILHSGTPILPDVPFFADGRKGRFMHDYYFETSVREGGYSQDTMWVFNSKQVTKLLRAYHELEDENAPMPLTLRI